VYTQHTKILHSFFMSVQCNNDD